MEPSPPMNSHLRAPWSLALTLLFVVAGCGGDDGGLEPRYSVTGTVKYKGELVKKASISFVPTKPDGHSATGNVVDGYYSLTTLNPGDGAIPGTYKVMVDDRELDQSKLRDEADALGKKKGVTYNQIPQELQGAALKKMKSSLPGKYQIPSTSDIEKEVKAESNKIDIELKD
jgi:hypothetical protein